MKSFDKIFFGFLIGFAFPFFLSLLSLLLWFFIDKNESRALIYLSAGLLLGLMIDWKYLKNWVNKRYDLAIWFITLIYIIYNSVVYGFFMGFPVFNLFLGLVAGYYFGKRVCFRKLKSEMSSKIITQVSLFTGLIMTLICISSGLIALLDNYTGSTIKGMLGLSFEVTKEMILTIIIIGGLSLIIAEYFITRLVMQKTIKLNNNT